MQDKIRDIKFGMDKFKKQRTLIIGAGLSGLAAAKHLNEHLKDKIELKILEGSGEIGGRTRTRFHESFGLIELGAKWIHGIKNNPIYNIMKDYNLLEPEIEKDNFQQHYLVENEEKELNEEEIKIVKEIINEYKSVYDEFNNINKTYDINLSITPYLKTKLEAIKKKFKSTRYIEGAWDNRNKLTMAIEGFHSTDEFSIEGHKNYEEFEGPHITIPRGYQALALEMAKNLDIKLNHIVTKINYDDNGIIVNCENGSSFEADYVIVTVSLGVLKSWTKQHVFHPGLPEDKISSIEKLGFGTSEHFHLDFKPDSLLMPLSNLYGDNNKKLKINTKAYSHFQLFWKSGSILEEEKWIKGFFCIRFLKAIDDLNDKNSKPLACLWITGEDAIDMENKSEKECEKVKDYLYKSFPYLSKSDESCSKDAVRVIRSTWGHDPLFRGCYSFIKVGSSVNDYTNISQPILINKIPRVMFCGEATHTKHFGTTHGAYLSGIREAARLIDFICDKP